MAMNDRILFLKLLGRLLVAAEDLNIQLIAFYFYRTAEEQKRLVQEGKSRVKRSRHQDWCAVDLAVVREGLPVWEHTRGDEYERLGGFWKSLNSRCRWGGDFGRTPSTLGWDPYHFELGKGGA